ncbi:MAG TPA: flagellar basal body rod protein FlgC [Caulobacteraceae bacterium]|jgi:flagellar basal-body rod protein FlgC|nr:flagellar basal body rod protein FlgC [Caulobacteraceae bacterium]
MADVLSPSDAIMAAASSALRAQQSRMRVIAENMANSDSVSKTAGGDPYRRQMPVFTPVMLDGGVEGVTMSSVAADPKPFPVQYQPGHPAADAKGNVKLPNVDPLMEAMDMRDAQRAYEANLNVIDTDKAMQTSLIQLLQK